MCASHWVAKPKGEMKVKDVLASSEVRSLAFASGRITVPSHRLARAVENERTCWDPKDGELCLSRMKPEETLVEVRSGSDVQIDRQTWV
jgi:hypothetical protein